MFKTMFSNVVAKNLSKKLINATITEDDIKPVLKELRISLLDGDVNLQVTKKFINAIKEKTVGQQLGPKDDPEKFVLNIVKQELIEILGKKHESINIDRKPTKIMFVGLQGSGKTTTLAKIANYYKSRNNLKPLMVAGDIYRPAAIDQLRTLSEQVRADFYDKGTQKPWQTAIEALQLARQQNNDLILFDTAGRLQTDSNLMDELRQVKKAFEPTEIILVVDGMSGQDIINVAQEFHNAIRLTGIIITKLDSDAKGGAALSLASILNVPIKFTGTGEKIGSLDLFYPERMADRILGLGDIMTLAEKAAEVMDEKKARNSLQRMLSGKLDLEDLLQQFEQMNKMGPLSGMMKMMPGQMQISEKKMEEAEQLIRVWKILMSSMTLKERRNPKLIKRDPRRRNRIIKGSGRKPDELNKLLKRWEEGQKQMEEVGRMLKKGKNPLTGGSMPGGLGGLF